jgi:uncharacterized protein YegJ (DUF2314 family)
MPTVGFVVYFRLSGNTTLPTERDIRQIGLDWLKAHCDAPLLPLLQDILGQNYIGVEISNREQTPDPPDQLIRAYNPGETEERRYREATHVAFVGGTDVLLPPRPGFWGTIALARALADSLPGGVVVDPEFPRLLPLSFARTSIPGDARLHLIDHILVPYSFDEKTGLLWITTKGMNRFGLPDLEMCDVPPNLAQPLLPVMNGLAQRLARAAMRYSEESAETLEESPPEFLPLRAEFTFSVEDVRQAYDRGEETNDIPETYGETRIRLEMRDSTEENEINPLIRVIPPSDFEGEMGVWLNSILDELFGSNPNLEIVEKGDAAMEEAHQQAISELSLVKARFQNGFRSGEVLHVKYGFPTADDGHEYMWVAITRWEGNRLVGRLANDPQYRHDLRAGQTIEVPEEDVYDWLIIHADGFMEGAYTNKVLQAPEEE